MKKLDLDSLGEIIDDFLKENEIHMLLTMPKGSNDVQIKDNAGMISVIQFYILLNAILPITADMQKEMGIDPQSHEWVKVVDTLLDLIKKEILGGSNDE